MAHRGSETTLLNSTPSPNSQNPARRPPLRLLSRHRCRRYRCLDNNRSGGRRHRPACGWTPCREAPLDNRMAMALAMASDGDEQSLVGPKQRPQTFWPKTKRNGGQRSPHIACALRPQQRRDGRCVPLDPRQDIVQVDGVRGVPVGQRRGDRELEGPLANGSGSVSAREPACLRNSARGVRAALVVVHLTAADGLIPPRVWAEPEPPNWPPPGPPDFKSQRFASLAI